MQKAYELLYVAAQFTTLAFRMRDPGLTRCLRDLVKAVAAVDVAMAAQAEVDEPLPVLSPRDNNPCQSVNLEAS